MISVLGNEQDLHMHSATALLYPMKRIQMTRHVWKMYCFQVLELTSIASSRVFLALGVHLLFLYLEGYKK